MHSRANVKVTENHTLGSTSHPIKYHLVPNNKHTNPGRPSNLVGDAWSADFGVQPLQLLCSWVADMGSWHYPPSFVILSPETCVSGLLDEQINCTGIRSKKCEFRAWCSGWSQSELHGEPLPTSSELRDCNKGIVALNLFW